MFTLAQASLRAGCGALAPAPAPARIAGMALEALREGASG